MSPQFHTQHIPVESFTPPQCLIFEQSPCDGNGWQGLQDGFVVQALERRGGYEHIFQKAGMFGIDLPVDDCIAMGTGVSAAGIRRIRLSEHVEQPLPRFEF